MFSLDNVYRIKILIPALDTRAWICLVNSAQGALPDFVTAPVSADLYVSN